MLRPDMNTRARRLALGHRIVDRVRSLLRSGQASHPMIYHVGPLAHEVSDHVVEGWYINVIILAQ
jgi:hypothetical protein